VSRHPVWDRNREEFSAGTVSAMLGGDAEVVVGIVVTVNTVVGIVVTVNTEVVTELECGLVVPGS